MQCLTYAVQQLENYWGKNPAIRKSKYAYQYFGNVPKENQFMHARSHSVAVWKTKESEPGVPDGQPGHAVYIESVDSDGKITMSHSNWGTTQKEKEKIKTWTFDDAYDMNQRISKENLEFIGYVGFKE